MGLRPFLLTILTLVLSTVPTQAQNATAEVEEQLGQYVPLDLQLTDQDGKLVELGALIDRPTILSLVYHTCPAVCRPLMEDLSKTLGKMDIEPGVDYDLITISFDEDDTAATARDFKDRTMASLDDDFPEDAWTFLVGDKDAIERMTASVGFRFKRTGLDFAHPTTVIVLAKDGMVSRYLLGAEFLPADLKMAVYEASQGRTGGTISKFFQFCFSYDPSGRGYVLNITRVVGTGMLLGVVGFAVFLTAATRRRNRELSENG